MICAMPMVDDGDALAFLLLWIVPIVLLVGLALLWWVLPDDWELAVLLVPIVGGFLLGKA